MSTRHSGQMQHNWWCEWMEKFPVRKRLTVDILHQGLWFQDNGIWTKVGLRPFIALYAPLKYYCKSQDLSVRALNQKQWVENHVQLSSYLIHSFWMGRSKKHITSIKTAHALCAKQLRRLSLGFIPLGAWMDKYFPIHPFSGLKQPYFIFFFPWQTVSVRFTDLSFKDTFTCHLF